MPGLLRGNLVGGETLLPVHLRDAAEPGRETIAGRPRPR
jgi:hypothetical protein